jgi:hypothetical protein
MQRLRYSATRKRLDSALARPVGLIMLKKNVNSWVKHQIQPEREVR